MVQPGLRIYPLSRSASDYARTRSRPHAEFAPSQPRWQPRWQCIDGRLVISQVQKLVEVVTPYLVPVSDNPHPFIFTLLAGILVFAVYMFKQAGSAMERMQQAKISKSAVVDKKDERPGQDSSSADTTTRTTTARTVNNPTTSRL